MTDLKLIGAIALLTGIPLSIVFVLRRDRANRRRALAHMAAHPALAPDEYSLRYFPVEQAGIARRIRELLAPHLRLDLSRIHPDDRLVEELHMDDLDSLSTVEFVLALEEEFKIEIAREDLGRVFTLRELTALVARKLAERAA